MKIDGKRQRMILGGVAVLVAAVAIGMLVFDRDHAGMEGMGAGAPGEAGQGDGMDMGGMQMDDAAVRIDPQMARSLGVTVATAELGSLQRELRTTGNVTYDETRLSTVTPKFGGFVERLHVDFTGQVVRRGQPVLEIYSPELVSAQEELLSAVRLEQRLAASRAPGVAERSGGLVESARRRFLLWDISPEQVEEIERSGEIRRTLTLHALSGGFVVEKAVQAGQSVQPGEILYRLADLSSVWVEADVYEQDLRFIALNESVEVEVAAYPGERFTGRISYVHPDVRRETRTGRVRIQLPNPDGRVKPGMFVTVHIDAPLVERAVLVPRDAVMRTGTRDIVFVPQAPGHYEIREVRTGMDAGGRTQILSGLLVGEQVVARANFILDAESRLMETMAGQPGMPGMDMNMEMDGAGGARMNDSGGMEMGAATPNSKEDAIAHPDHDR
ncbi:MAG: efflux RND transporter periplasmic adaptor subunit [Deferrisomatales bacterium]|nr:efflux RND transporter periplasmic adaptor subunit [Deferrisomatales bacterium]